MIKMLFRALSSWDPQYKEMLKATRGICLNSRTRQYGVSILKVFWNEGRVVLCSLFNIKEATNLMGKTEAVNTFVLMGTEYHVNAALLNKTWLMKMDSQVRQIVKKALNYEKNIKCLSPHSKEVWMIRCYFARGPLDFDLTDWQKVEAINILSRYCMDEPEMSIFNGQQ